MGLEEDLHISDARFEDAVQYFCTARTSLRHRLRLTAATRCFLPGVRHTSQCPYTQSWSESAAGRSINDVWRRGMQFRRSQKFRDAGWTANPLGSRRSIISKFCIVRCRNIWPICPGKTYQ